MRVLSVIFIFATLAIFGAMAQESIEDICKDKCAGYPEEKVCASIYGKDSTLNNMCEYDCLNAKSEAGQDNGLIEFLHEGNCVVPTKENCLPECPRNIDPLCFSLNGEKQTAPNYCVLRTYFNCAEAQLLENGDGPVIKFESIGECPGDEGLMTVGWFGP